MNYKPIKINFIPMFYRLNKNGKCVIKCRLRYNDEKIEFSTGIFIIPESWNRKNQNVHPPNQENDFINSELSLIKNKLNQAFLLLKVQEKSFTLEDVILIFKGETPKKEKGLISYFESYLEKKKKLIDIEIKDSTWKKFNYVLNDVKSFIEWKFQKKDIELNKVDKFFLDDFEYFLKTEKRQSQVTINKVIQRLKGIFKLAYDEKFIDSLMFQGHKAKRVNKTIVYLSHEELNKIESHIFHQERLEKIRDLFIFCCYTGLPYNEMANLKKENISVSFDNNLWIKIKREKTQGNLSIPMLPKAIEIMEKYQNENSELVFNLISNQKFNSYLKEIAFIIGINKNLTHHVARKTFASTILLYNDVSIEVVSKLLGHSKISITQEYYAEVADKKISSVINELSKKL
ncbi:site-specific integrase [Flavobacterium fontis]|nr:site-specific integrase [Flavobacterium fontis]